MNYENVKVIVPILIMLTGLCLLVMSAYQVSTGGIAGSLCLIVTGIAVALIVNRSLPNE